MKKILTAIAVLAAVVTKAQTVVHIDSAANLTYVNIEPVSWPLGLGTATRLYITNYNSNLASAVSVSANTAYLTEPGTHPIFIGTTITSAYTGADYDSVRVYGKAYIYRDIARAKNLTIID